MENKIPISRLLVGSPWSGFPKNRMGDVYKCPVDLSTTTCEKLNLQSKLSLAMCFFYTFQNLVIYSVEKRQQNQSEFCLQEIYTAFVAFISVVTWGPTVSKFPTQFDDLIK